MTQQLRDIFPSQKFLVRSRDAKPRGQRKVRHHHQSHYPWLHSSWNIIDAKVPLDTGNAGTTIHKVLLKYDMFKYDQNYPVNTIYVTNTTNIFGCGLASTRGNTTNKQSQAIIKDYVIVSRHLWDINKEVILSVNMVFMGKARFLSQYPEGSISLHKSMCPITQIIF